MINAQFHPCACCGKNLIGEPGTYEICPICEWEDDPVQSGDPDFTGGANRPALNEARKLFLDKQRKPQYDSSFYRIKN
ncbi:CPCC family cysteine-rich protein [Type-E symbiont of Plautia stali]|uniref:CPCC family cysteine-rich protein n=1 Tax=Type-E symbiont of Plautia stali TaxID=1560357 RepID=UPI0009319285|nr:CPCC family cysteine-rich protein [Type-E symbiont of Plautia stali]